MTTIVPRFFLILAVACALSGCGGEPAIRIAEADVSLTEKLTFDQARTLVDRGKVTEAISLLRNLSREGGPSVSILNGLAIAHAELGRPDLAADYFAKALAIRPEDPMTLNNIGFAAIRRKETRMARHYLERAARAGEGMATIGGNLSILDRLETWKAPSRAVVASPFSAAGGNSPDLERRTMSAVRLSGLRADRQARTEPEGARPLPSSGMIDFSELFDPWGDGRPPE